VGQGPMSASVVLSDAGVGTIEQLAGSGQAVLLEREPHFPANGSVSVLGGLGPEEATEYAGDLLALYAAAAPRRADRAFGELMQWLDGHPLSMRLVLPHLDTTGPGVLLAGLQGTARLPGWDDGQGGRLTSPSASLGYSHANLDPSHQELSMLPKFDEPARNLDPDPPA
jgi:hypothetical protein